MINELVLILFFKQGLLVLTVLMIFKALEKFFMVIKLVEPELVDLMELFK